MSGTAEESIGTHVFAIQELLMLVLSYISPPGKGSISAIDTGTLASLARVSRNLSNAALNALWRSIHRPDAIIQLLPRDSYELSQNDETGAKQYRLKRPLKSGDFESFDKYAPRIQYVDFSNSSRILGPGCELFPYIKEFRDPILPALADFRWEPSVQNGCIGAFHLLCREASLPSQEFSLLMWSEIEHPTEESEVIARTIDAFNDPALPWLPNVKKLTLRTLHYLPAIESAIQRYSGFQHFSSDLRVSGALLKHLSILPHLRFLDLRSLDGSATADISNTPDHSHFPALGALRFSGNITSMAQLCPLVSSPHLSSVFLRTDLSNAPPAAHPLAPTLSTLFASLLPPSVPARTSTSGLAHFVFARSSTRSVVNTLTAGTLPSKLSLADAFSPLYACAGLQTFRVDVDPLTLSMTDADVRAIAHAWPLLTALVITPPRAKRIAPPNVGLYALWNLASRCQRLRTLAIEVDADVADAFRAWNDASADGDGDAEELRRSLSGHSVVMEELTLFSSPCGDKPLLVADFLNRAFPRLPERAFHVYWSGEAQDGRRRWDVVVEALGHR
ncbi:hypothetical protein R3P38DRAFT_475286 [Favolaschia claudopus]|uniref:F-box domain-containing protein n=1 Tax=Favolaschia claudopus TaxID=2862362 RepID=A0AAW0CK16_9AGAR